jgi:hypothetical protein
MRDKTQIQDMLRSELVKLKITNNNTILLRVQKMKMLNEQVGRPRTNERRRTKKECTQIQEECLWSLAARCDPKENND